MARRLPAGYRPTSCPPCLRANLPIRTFTSTTTSWDNSKSETQSAASAVRAKNAIPPESPRFTPNLASVQATHIPQPRIRGILPAPRNILKRKDRAGRRIYSNENLWDHIMKAVPKSMAAEKSEGSEDKPKINSVSPRQQWKDLLSAQRRQNLLEGIVELKTRKSKIRNHSKAKSEIRKAERAARKAEREARRDEELTNPTTTLAMQVPPKGRIPDPNREARVAEMRARVATFENRKVADRKTALHTLYIHARNFITTEEQLDAAIDKCFGTPDEPRTWGNQGVSVWSLKEPESLAQKVARANRTRTNNQEETHGQGYSQTAESRIRRIAEELTGGKIPPP